MPELPEVESLRRSLEDQVLGATLRRLEVGRAEVVLDELHAPLAGMAIGSLRRRGKLLCMVEGTAGRTVCVHLGMSGRLLVVAPQASPTRHEHVRMHLARPDGRLLDLAFIDPRRFGGVSLHPSLAQAEGSRMAAMGPDALSIHPVVLADRLAGRARSIKAALLDQGIVAGIGNIYCDEILHRAGLRPSRRCRRIPRATLLRLGELVQEVLRAAIEAGGSTLRDYRDALGRAGTAQLLHQVYGRIGFPCRRCGGILRAQVIAGRTSCFCPSCQH